MGWFTKLLKGSNRKSSGGRYHGKYEDGRISDNLDCSADDLTDIEKEEIGRAIALSLSEADKKGKKVIEDDSESEDDELCPLSDEEAESVGEVQQDEDDHHAKIQQDEDKHLDEVQLEEDEQLARAIQESLSISSPPRSETDSLFQPFAHLFPPVYRICAGCNAEIGHGRFLSCMGGYWHPECFCCHACKLPITDYEFSMSGNRRYHKSCYKELHHPRCDVCKNFIPPNSAGLIEYRAHPFWLQKYCPSHERDGTPRCCSCQRLESVDTKYLLLDDGRKLCLECLDSAIMDTHECQPLYVEIQEFYEGLHMKIEQQVPMLLVERQALNEAMEGEKNGHHHLPETRGLCLSEEQTVPTILRRPRIGAGYQLIDMITEPFRLVRRCEVTAILVLYGLPRLLTGSILAHEMMHAWLRLKGYGNLRPEVEEGICQVLAHMWQINVGTSDSICITKYLATVENDKTVEFHFLNFSSELRPVLGFPTAMYQAELTSEQVLRRDIPWETYMSTKLISGTSLQLLRRYDHRPESHRAQLLDDDGPSYVRVFVRVLRDIFKEDTVEYVLALIDEMLAANPKRARLFHDSALADEDTYEPFLSYYLLPLFVGPSSPPPQSPFSTVRCCRRRFPAVSLPLFTSFSSSSLHFLLLLCPNPSLSKSKPRSDRNQISNDALFSMFCATRNAFSTPWTPQLQPHHVLHDLKRNHCDRKVKRHAQVQLQVVEALVWNPGPSESPAAINPCGINSYGQHFVPRNVHIRDLLYTCTSYYLPSYCKISPFSDYSVRPKNQNGVVSNGEASNGKKPFTTIDDVLIGLVKWLCEQADGVKLLVPLISPASTQQSIQLLYETCLCIWLLSYYEPAIEYLATSRTLPRLIDVVRSSTKEKVVRVVVLTLKNLMSKGTLGAQMVDLQLAQVVLSLKAQAWSDEDLLEALNSLEEGLKDNIKRLSSFDMYKQEVLLGHLDWSPMHKDPIFWRENINNFEENDFQILRVLLTILDTSSDPRTLAVACYDLSQFIQHHSAGRIIVSDLKAKERVMKLMNHENVEVTKNALLCIQRLFLGAKYASFLQV
ncbi:hypothetical protein JHK87_003155 [Glycine soja]|nr:hypothetical protein JHK87_003155 [Glycine soja]